VLRHRSLLNGSGGTGSGFYPLRRTAGRVDRTQGAVAGDRRGLVRVGVKRTVKGSQISRLYTTRWARRSRNHSISVGGFAALRHILTIEPLACESRVSKAVIGRFLPFQNGRYWPIAVSQRVSKGIEPCVDASLLSQRDQVFDAILLNDATHIIGAACIHMQKALPEPGQPLIEIDQHLHQ